MANGFARVVAARAGFCNQPVQVAGADRPADDPRHLKPVDAERAGLLGVAAVGIGTDDLQVPAAAQVDQVVGGAEPDVAAAGHRLDAGEPGEPRDSLAEIRRGEDEVVEHRLSLPRSLRHSPGGAELGCGRGGAGRRTSELANRPHQSLGSGEAGGPVALETSVRKSQARESNLTSQPETHRTILA
jgi:hypothetical protein